MQTEMGFVSALPVSVIFAGMTGTRDITYNVTGWLHGTMRKMYTLNVSTVIGLEVGNSISMELKSIKSMGKVPRKNLS
jgi:hypothetical protein